MKKKLTGLLMALFVTLSIAACSNNNDGPHAKVFVLVHGAWQATYAWDAVKAQLEKNGQKVVVVELPGHGADHTNPATLTMDVYRDKVIAAVNAVNGKVILVGHSMGGVIISAVAEKVPAKIARLVYVGAIVPANGQSLGELASKDTESKLSPAIIPSADQLTLDVQQDRVIPIFIQDGSEAVKALVKSNYRPEPAIPFGNPVTLTAANFGKVDKFYVHTLQDSAIGISAQRRMVAVAKIVKVDSMATSHCPFLSKPTELTAILLKAAK